MLVLFILLIIIASFGLKIHKDKGYNYLSPSVTRSVCGFFVPIIFFSHIIIAFSCNNFLDYPVEFLCHSILIQLMVVPFLFYGAFGITKQYLMGGSNYSKNFLIQRFLKIFLCYMFLLIICRFIKFIASGFQNYEISLLDLTLWNGEWFIFVILIEYIFTIIGFAISKKRKLIFLISNAVLTTIFVVLLIIFQKGTHYYNTIFAYPFGIFWALYQEKIDKFIDKKTNYITVFLVSVFLLISLKLMFHFWTINDILYGCLHNLVSICFMTIILLFTKKIQFGNRILIAINSYTIYSLLFQGEFNGIFRGTLNLLQYHRYLYVLASLSATIMMCIIIRFVFEKIWKATFSKLKFTE